jgi:hypothetical protein
MKRLRGVAAAFVMSVAATVLTQGAPPAQQPQPPADPPMPAVLKDYKPVTAERLRKPDDQDWLMIRRTYDGWGFSPLSDITPANVQRLKPVWVFSTGEARVHQAAPLVNGGTLPIPPALAATAAPKFRVDSAWPKIPNGWQFGQVSSVSIDADDHVWVLQRPGTLGPEEKSKAAPPVLEFTADGAFVRAWGGPGPGYEWPSSEHGIYVDPNGFVWVGGNGTNDHQILKFRKDGSFVMQIGHAGKSRGNADTENLNQPADAFVHAPTNELVVADGYGNRRIIVFDADTGKFKRMWGAFGNVPKDDPPNPANADAEPQGASQFVQPVHAARVSRDGLVYVSDRGGKRVQVFRLDGTYVTQVFIGRDCKAPDCGNGTTAASTAFSTDPEQRFLYVGNRSQAKVMVFERRGLELLDTFGEWGSAPGQFGTLHHMAADSKGNLYVTEVTPLRPENRRVQKFVLQP